MKQNLNEQKGGLFYSIASIVPLVSSVVFAIVIALMGLELNREATWFLYAQFLLTQIPFLILLVVYGRVQKLSLSDLGVKKTNWKYFVYAILMQIGVFFALGSLNEWFVGVLGDLFGYVPSETLLPPMEGFGIVTVFLTVAVLPAITEELMFRGIMVGSTRKFGLVFCVLVNGALFALFHENPAQTAYQFICGCLFALLAYRSGSVLPTMLAHFLNNGAIVLFQYFEYDPFSEPNFPFHAIVSAVLLVAMIVVSLLDKGEAEEKSGEKKFFWIPAAVGIFVCGVLWISNFFSL